MDALEDYNSEEDEDYVPGIDADDDFPQSGQHAGGKGKGTKRKRGAAGVELSAPKRVPLTAKIAKKKGPARIGAAVLSDDDDDLMQPPRDDATAEDERREDSAQQSRSTEREEERKESESHIAASDSGNSPEEEMKEDRQSSAADGSATTAAMQAGQTDAPAHSTTADISLTITLPAPSSTLASSSPSSATPSTASSSATAPLSSPPSSSSKSTASAKGGDLASILAQFNKKPATAKPATKKVINPWELPAKPKPPTTPIPTASTTPHTPSTSITTTTATATHSTAPAAALSNEQVVVSDITSYAGETIQITKTLIRGSPEELAHRAATHSANNLTTLLSSLTSRQSINTLEKSRIDWSVSKQEEGDEDELRRFVGSKEALVDRMAFLARAERREWEKVKEAREAGKKHTMTTSTEGMDRD